MIDFWYRWCLISNFKNLKSAFDSWWFFALDWLLKVIFKSDDWCVCSLFTIGLSGFDVCELSQQRKVFEHLQLLQYWFDFNFGWFYRLRMMFFVWLQIFLLSNCQVLVAEGVFTSNSWAQVVSRNTTLQAMQNCTHISIIDCFDFFYQWRVHSSDRHKLTIVTHREQKTFNVAVMNYRNSSFYVQR